MREVLNQSGLQVEASDGSPLSEGSTVYRIAMFSGPDLVASVTIPSAIPSAALVAILVDRGDLQAGPHAAITEEAEAEDPTDTFDSCQDAPESTDATVPGYDGPGETAAT